MLTICLGPNGSGKSLWAMHQVVRALRKDKRNIITSLAIDFGELNVYMQRKWPDENHNVCERVVHITKEQQRQFWRFRMGRAELYWDDGTGEGVYVWTAVNRGPFGGEGWKVPDGGVLYILDEIQTTFNARDWHKTGSEFVEYQTQHRKMGDDVIAIGPASSLIEKQFRVLAGECVVLSNLYKLKIGMWKAPRKIVWHLYQNCPPAPGEDHLQKGEFKIDAAGLAKCYRTEEGLGIVGAQADKGKEAKGAPMYLMFVGLICLLGLAWWLMSAVVKFAHRKGVQGARMPEQAKSAEVKTPEREAPFSAPAGESKTKASVSGVVVEGVKWTGYSKLPGERYFYVFLENGSTYRVAEDRLLVRGRDLFIPSVGWIEQSQRMPAGGEREAPGVVVPDAVQRESGSLLMVIGER